MTKFTARRLGSRCRVTGRSAVSGSSSLSSSTVSVLASQRHCSSVRTHTPTLADPPLSPLRAAAIRPSGTRRVGPAGNGSGSGGGSAGASSRVSVAQGMSTRVPSACTAMCGTLVAVDIAGGEHPVHLTVAGRRGDGESRIAGQRQFHCGRGELASDIRRVGVADHAAQQRAGRFLGVGVGVVGAGQRPLQLGGLDACSASLQLASHQLGLFVDVQAGQHERHRVAESADAVQRDLQRGRRRFAGHAADPHPVGAVEASDSSMVSIRAVTSGLA